MPSLRPLHYVIVAFAACQLPFVLLGNGAFTDEGIYILAGRSVLFGTRDLVDYPLWLDGSPFLYPTLSALAHALGGLAGSRLLSVALCSAGLWFFARFVERCFGENEAFWASVYLAIHGAFFALAHLAVYDALAFAALTCALWSGLELLSSPSPRYLWRTALAVALAATAKYSTFILLLGGLPVVMLAASRRRWAPIALAVLLAGGLAALYMYIAHGELIPRLTLEILTTHPDFGDRSRLAFEVGCSLALPVMLAVAGAVQLRGRAHLAGCMIAAGLTWPALHLLLGESVSANKHVALSGVYLYPLAGVAMARVFARSRALAHAVLTGAVAWGGLQVFVQDRSWPDMRPVAEYLLPQLGPYDTVGSYTGWDFAMYAVVEGRLANPSFVMSEWRTRGGEDPCSNLWIIGNEARASGSRAPADSQRLDAFAGAARRCGFERVQSFPARTYALAPPLVESTPSELVVYRRRSLNAQLGPTPRN